MRLPKGVFAPYTPINTNVLFFEKGRPTTAVWYYEHPYPAGYKSYSKTKPMRIEEFDAEKAWWSDRRETEQAWRVPIGAIAERDFNLDIKNPNAPEAKIHDPAEVLAEYHAAMAEAQAAAATLSAAIGTALREARGG